MLLSDEEIATVRVGTKVKYRFFGEGPEQIAKVTSISEIITRHDYVEWVFSVDKGYGPILIGEGELTGVAEEEEDGE